MKEDKKLKKFLVFQSFAPLFILIFIKHIRLIHIKLVIAFISSIFHGEWSVFTKIWNHSELGDIVVTILCIIWLVITIFISHGFRELQSLSFDSHGETITIKTEKKDSGITFLMSFILPLLVDDVSSLRGFVFFTVLLMMVIILLVRSNLFYQNPVLVVQKYRTYEFKFNNPYQDVEGKKTYIGISKKRMPIDEEIICRRYIADDVFLISVD